MLTADTVNAAVWLLDTGKRPAIVASRLGIALDVVRVLDRNRRDAEWRRRPSPTSEHTTSRSLAHNHVGATTLRMIRRALSVGILTREEIAREFDVSPGIVTAVEMGREEVATRDARFAPGEDEMFLASPQRCPGCGATILVAPCRVCRIRSLTRKRKPK